MRQLAVLVAKAFQFKEPVLLVGETGGGKTTVCKLIAEINHQQLVSVNCHMHTESSDFIGGLRPVRDHVVQFARHLPVIFMFIIFFRTIMLINSSSGSMVL